MIEDENANRIGNIQIPMLVSYPDKTNSFSKNSKLHAPMAKYHLFAAIAKRPCHLDKEYVEIHPGLYRRSCNKHLVFYRLIENGDIEIVRILHERMDIASKFE